MKGFTVYRSSAGSGKTYTLVKTYLTLLFSINNDYGFKQILGITFTNKAADEMKNRVFEALEAITKEGVNNSLAIEISKENNFKLNEIVHRAENIFYKILHNYADFNLMTIDKFTNKVIRAFANELGLSSSYEVILEEIDFLEQAVSDFVDQSASDSFHLDLIQNLIDESIRQGAQNDIEKQLKKLNKIIFDSDLEQHSLLDEKKLLKLRNHVVSEIKNCENQIKIFCNDGNALILQNSIEISWQSYGRLNKVFDAFNQFQKLNIQELEKWDSWLENDQWFKKSLNSNQLNIITALKPEIESVVNKIIDFAKKWLKLIEVHKFITPFSMVQALINTIEIKKRNNNSILISDFNFLVSDIIKQEPAGFIFERIGSRYQYILVDEFQDTSSMQWENLVPLIHESISSGGKNLIVGDAKQAIYRWRKGNVKQFLDLPYLGDSYLKSNYELLLRSANNSMVLDDNWRSSKNIVEFNKWLFNKVANSTGSQNVIDAYKDVSQNFKRDFDGDVNVILKPKEGFDLNNYLKLNIDSVLSIGYQYKDIAILVRSKNDGLKTINSLQEIDIPFISEDSIFLSSSVSYKLIFYGISYFEFNRTKDFKLLLHFLSIYYKNQKNDFEEIKTTLSNLNFDEYHQLFDFQKLHYCSNILKLGSDDPYVEKF
ncbi:MAG: UvrD-helicase domain-containing protein [Parvicellaceae bacterium]